MNAVILAGGRDRGEQLLPLAFPCPLLPLANRPLLEYQVAWLAAHGVKEAIVAVDHRGVSFAAPRAGEIEVRICYTPGPVGPASAFALAAAATGRHERVVVVDGCLLTDVDLRALVDAHDRAGVSVTTASPVDGSGRRHPATRPGTGLSVIDGAQLPTGGRRHTVRLAGYWRDVRSSADYLAAGLEVLAGRLGPLPGHEIAPGVHVEGTVHLLSSATLLGPLLLGAGTVVGEGATVAGSVLGNGCLIAAGARVERSVLLDGARIGRGAVVLDSIVGPSAAVAEGASVAGGSVVGPGARIATGRRLSHDRVA